MHARFKMAVVIASVLTIGVIVGYQNRSSSPIEYHKRAIEAVEARMGRTRLTDRVRQWLGRPPADPLNALAHHQQALLDAGFLSRRDLTLTHDYDLRLFSPSNMLSVGGEFSYVWFTSGSRNQLTVIAKPERIERLTRWIHEHDSGNR